MMIHFRVLRKNYRFNSCRMKINDVFVLLNGKERLPEKCVFY